jgi:hypothetical protein
MMYKGEGDPQELLEQAAREGEQELATVGYGVGNWYLVAGDLPRAAAVFARVLRTDAWPAFGYVAAEADMARIMDRAF